MRIAVCKIGANITFSSSNKSAANADILYALRTIGVADNVITIVSRRTRNTVLPSLLKFQDIRETSSFNDYDCVLVFNGSINFFGGVEDPSLLQLYRALHNTTKRIFFVQTDGAMWFQELWPIIYKREWAKTYTEEEFRVNPEQVIYLTQGRDLEKVHKQLTKQKNAFEPKAIIHYPWERTILMHHEKHYNKPLNPFSNREYDLGFGGATRNLYKRRKVEKYYDSPELKTLLFGNLRGIELRHTRVKPKVSYQDMNTLMKKCKATVVFGDEFYNNNFHTLRMYEGILAGCLVLLDREFDHTSDFYFSIFDELTVDNIKPVQNFCNYERAEQLAFAARKLVLASWVDDVERTKLNDLLGDLS